MEADTTKVLIVLTSNDRRGAEIEGSALGSELAARGVTTTVVALAPGSSPRMLAVPTLGSSPLRLDTLRALRRFAKEHHVVIAYGSSTLPACAIALTATRVPWVYRSIGDPAAWSSGALQRLRTTLLLRHVSRVVALWPEAGHWFVDRYGVLQEHILVIPNARSPETFRPPTTEERRAARLQFGLDADRPVIGVVGSLSSEKRVDLAIAAIAEVDGAVALIVGDGPERSRLEIVGHERLPGRATFTGVLDDVQPAYWAMDALLLTSRTEGMPGVVIEAAMSRVPVVGPSVGAIPSMIAQGIPVRTVTPDNASRVAAALSEVMALPPQSLDDSDFGWCRVAGRWNELVAELVGHVPHRLEDDSEDVS